MKNGKIGIKKILLRLTAAILAAATAFGCLCLGIFLFRKASVHSLEADDVVGKAKSFVLMIGDGMGFAHIAAADAYKKAATGEGLFLTSGSETSSGEVSTHSKALFLPTDSAAAATAMSAGVKTANGKIARAGGKNLQTMTEYAVALGKATGIIATETLAGATPAAFSAHADNRSDKTDIIKSQTESGVTLFIGEGKADYAPFIGEIEANGYSYVLKGAQLDLNARKLFANVEIGEKDEEISLADACLFALKFLSENENGFFLMAEGSRIDKRSHANDLFGMIEQLTEFDDAVKAVYENLPENTALIVTADHETGALRYASGQDLSTAKFRRTYHSSENVPYFAFNLVLPETIDNTHIRRAAELAFGD